MQANYERLLEDIKRIIREAIEESKREDIAKIGEALMKMTVILEGILSELREHGKILQEHSKILKEHSEILKKHSEILGDHSKVLMELRVMVGSMGRRWGRDLEKMVLAIYRDELLRRGIDPERARRFSYVDVDGRFGLKGSIYEFDVVIEDDGVTIVEVKSRAEREDVEWFYDKVVRVRSLLGNVKRLVLVAVSIDEDALRRAGELGVDVVYGTLVE